jgi:hypothetical protein
MTTLHRVRTEWVERYHVDIDADATVLDCFTVELPTVTAGPMLVQGDDMNALWSEARAMLASLRAQPRAEIRGAPRSVFEPFGIITARNRNDVWREHETKMAMLLGGMGGEKLEELAKRYPELDMKQFHEERIASLIRAHDLLNDKVQKPVTVPWPDFKAFH